MSYILSEQVQINGVWVERNYEYETEEEAFYQGACDKAAGDCKYYEVYHSQKGE